MYIFHYFSLVSACIIFTLLNHKFINHRYKRFVPLVSALGCCLLVLLVMGLLKKVALFNHFWNFIYIILMVLMTAYAIVGLSVSIIYLVDTLIIQRLIVKFKIFSYALQSVVGMIFGAHIPILLFYITKIKIYNWFPNYEPYKNQKESAVIIIIAFVYWQTLSAIQLHNSKEINKKKLVLINYIICLIATLLGIYMQKFNLFRTFI